MLRALGPGAAFAGGIWGEALGRSGRTRESPTRAHVPDRRRRASARRRRASIPLRRVGARRARRPSNLHDARAARRKAVRSSRVFAPSTRRDGPGISPGPGPSRRGTRSSRACPRDVLLQRAARRRESRSEHMRRGDPARVSWIEPGPAHVHAGASEHASRRARGTIDLDPEWIPAQAGPPRTTGHLGAPVA